jgi:hypothetical protein
MSSSELSAQTPGAVDPGYTTTEFWQTVFVNVIASGVAVGSLFSNNFNLDGLNAIVPSVAVAAAAASQIFYNHSRAKVKAAAQSATAQVESAKVQSQAQATALVALNRAAPNDGAVNPDRSITISFSDALGNALVKPSTMS